MKKLIIAALISALSLTSLSAQDLPEYPDENVFVFDIQSYPGKAKDYIKLKNISHSENFGVTVYGWKKDSWKIAGSGFLRGIDDTDLLKGPAEADDYRYYAVRNNSGNKFKYYISKKHNDLYITFADQTDIETLEKNTPVSLKASDLKKRFKDHIRFWNLNSSIDHKVFYIYGSDSEDEGYELLTAVIIKDLNDTDIAEESYPNRPLNSYKYFKFACEDGTVYDYTFDVKLNDLFVFIN